MWTNYSNVTKLANQNKEYQTALFLHVTVSDMLMVGNDFQFTATKRKDNLDTVIAKFDQHFIWQSNKIYESCVFNKRDQILGENM